MDAAELIRTTSGPIGKIGGTHYFDAHVLARGKELGVDGFRFYFLGRAGMMGDVDAATVTSAFGYFTPAVVDKVWDSGRAKLPARDAATAAMEAAGELGRRLFAEIDAEVLDGFNDAAATIINNHDAAGQALFAGAAKMPLPDDPMARAFHQSIVLRELRGSAHLVAVVASGLTPAQAHAINSPDGLQLFGYSEAPEITDAHRTMWDAAEEMTSQIMMPAVNTLSQDQMEAFATGVEQMHAAVMAAENAAEAGG